MHFLEKQKMTFIKNLTNYYYEVTFFGLKNMETTYQRLMDHMFKKQK